MKYPNIEAERARNSLTQEKLSEAILVSRKTYKNWQDGKREIPGDKIIAMAKLFGVSSDYLLGIDSQTKVG